ncbi:beta-lactamase-like protein [Aspergillus bertholletiae]|uniref:Beta-lactamase-like protein n=1 Tax=Aspergillus bertholletiae TaxID=1226010 RepID=A0A5N7B016_9EURO|nr:beta-lactamase-like protein [Aspergillus bertholletiae]
MQDSNIELPTTDAYVDVQLLNGGSMTAKYHVLHAGEPADEFRLYNWAFYIYHAKQGRRMLWDLGMSSNPDDFPPAIANGPLEETRAQAPYEPIEKQIERRIGVTADEIDTILLSHAHFDHCRPISQTFKDATVLFGPGTSEYCAPGHFMIPTSTWDGRYFDPKRATERWGTVKGPWTRFGPFERAMDFFGDGSFWVIQAPGHMPGNLCACARLATGEWVMLASDCCHSRALLDGTKEFGAFELDGKIMSLHTDIAAAQDTLARIRIMEKELGVHVSLAHDTTWMQDENDPVLLSLLDKKFVKDMRVALPEQRPF